MNSSLAVYVGYLGYSVTKSYNYIVSQYVNQVTESQKLGYLWVTGNQVRPKVTEK